MTSFRSVSSKVALVAAAVGVYGGISGGAPATAEAAASPVVRLATAATPLRDSTGAYWEADNGFLGGSRWSTSATQGISGTSDDVLYRSEHYGMTSFHKAVTSGTYDVTLRMAEIYWGAAGRRVFDVTAEGSPVLKNVDIYAAVGKNAAYDKTFRVAVADGRLDLGFTDVKNHAKVAAISITKVVAGAQATISSTRPGRSNTGVPVGMVLKPSYGNITVTTPGATLDGLDVHGFVNVKAPNVRITRSIIRGGVATANTGLVTNYDPTATNLVVEDTELVPEHPSVWIDAIKGANYTIRRVNGHGTNDIVKIHGDNVRVESSWLHDSVWRPVDPNLGGTSTHNDGVQVLGGKNIRIIGNTITGNNNAGMQVTQDYSATTDLVFSQNYADGGGCTVNLAHKKMTSMSGLTVSANRFGRNTRVADCAIIATSATSVTATGNVWDDSGSAVRVRNGG